MPSQTQSPHALPTSSRGLVDLNPTHHIPMRQDLAIPDVDVCPCRPILGSHPFLPFWLKRY